MEQRKQRTLFTAVDFQSDEINRDAHCEVQNYRGYQNDYIQLFRLREAVAVILEICHSKIYRYKAQKLINSRRLYLNEQKDKRLNEQQHRRDAQSRFIETADNSV